MKSIIYESHHDKTKDLILSYSKNANISNHFHRSFEIIYMIKGKMETEVGNEKFIASEDDIIFVNKYYSHSYKVIGEYEKYVIIIPPRICNDFDDIFNNKTLQTFLTDKEFNKTLLPIISSLKNKFKDVSPLVKKGYVNVIVGELIGHYKLVDINRNSNIELLVKILDYIDSNYSNELNLEIISNHFGYSKYYFSRLFNDFMGESINNYINIIRVQAVVKKLKNKENRNISDIAYSCGFNSLTTFYRSFKKIYGNNPKEEFTINE